MSHYNKIAGQKIHRIETLSDAVFAVAMTLLVLDLKMPVNNSIFTETDLAMSFVKIIPKLLVYFLSFMTVGIFWSGQATQFQYINKSDRNLNWISLIFLLFVSIIPFTTAFLSQHIAFKFSIFIYWLNILFLGLMMFINWQYAFKNNFLDIPNNEKRTIHKAILKRIITAQTLYFIGALLCFINIYLSISVIIAIQLNYAFAIISTKQKKSFEN